MKLFLLNAKLPVCKSKERLYRHDIVNPGFVQNYYFPSRVQKYLY